MNIRFSIFLFCVAFLLNPRASLAQSPSTPEPLTGTWDCLSHGAPRGDVPFTLFLDQSGETVTGSVTSPLGDADITSATFKNGTLKIEIDSDEGNYILTAKLAGDKLTGEWTHLKDKGTWQGAKKDSNSTHNQDQ